MESHLYPQAHASHDATSILSYLPVAPLWLTYKRSAVAKQT